MWFRPLSITLVVKRTRTGWQVSIRVQFTNQDWGRAKSSSLLQDQYSNLAAQVHYCCNTCLISIRFDRTRRI